ncbi:MAG TPA: right-handed parallel beta-helix repeat-containing protein [Nannocystaceae bacterium]|nr:right-handed parallel beta-helix repeat-containing protein [Nannocystaceae bacterium]
MAWRRLALAWSIGCAAGCFGRADAFACIDDSDCNAAVDGRCELSGFCSYPDATCDAGRRYDDLASDALDRTCVDASGESTTAVAEDSSEVGSGSGSSAADSSTAGSSTGDAPCPDCVDLDGDGYGMGAACAGDDCDDANAARNTGCRYVGPGGDDANAGDDPDAPWGTLAYAIGQLAPGDSLVLMSGEYETATTGLLHAQCGDGGNAQPATPELPISIRALEERQAVLHSAGDDVPISLDGCDGWVLTGLTALGSDLAEGATSVVELRDAQDVRAQRLLVGTPNWLVQSHAIDVVGCTDAVLEEIEIYDFHLTGVYVQGSTGVTMRRLYVNARGRVDSPDAPSSIPDTGDSGVRIVDGTGHRIENCIFTQLAYGVYAQSDVEILGSISVDVFSGLLAQTGRPTLRDVVVIDGARHGLDVRSTAQATIDGATVIGSALNGLNVYEEPTKPCDPIEGCAATARNVLVLGSENTGIYGAAPIDWNVASANAFGNGDDYVGDEAIDDDLDRIQRSLSEPVDDIGLSLGQCVVYIPEDSTMHGRGEDGADIGANILMRTEDGVVTDTPLWDPMTGAFPCGDFAAELNNRPGDSCFDVHERLNVRQNGCELPAQPEACERDG